MAILITTARFTADGAQGGLLVARSEHMEAAARQLIAGIGGTLIGCYRTSGDHDSSSSSKRPRTRRQCRRSTLPPREAA